MMDFSLFFEEQQRLLANVVLKHKRYLYSQISWEQRCLLITGQRGVGKTTLMLQHLKEHYDRSPKALYISVDNPYFKNISLYEFASEFEKFGGEILYIDEIHKYSEWSTHIKSIYDAGKLKLVISGSSMIQIHEQEADLSRRVRLYRLANLSFREYLSFKNIAEFESISMEKIFSDHTSIASGISQQIKPLMYFKEYLLNGCYPFIIEHNQSYTHHLIGVINQILEVDMPYATNIKHAQIDKIKKLVYLLSTSVPMKPNISKLAMTIEVSRPTLMEYLYYLELGSLVNSVNQQARGYGVVSKPDKLYMYNTNLMHAISHNADKGTQREAFFVNQIKSALYNEPKLINEDLLLAAQGDFLVENRYTVEIGGKNKSFKQVKDITSAFVVADDIEVGFGNKIPLWLFGFLY
jgi:predicted AAA+ superfamily ATPase